MHEARPQTTATLIATVAVGKVRIFALAALATVALVPAAHGTLLTPRTTAPDVFVTVQVKITDARITVSPRVAYRGDEGRFIITNVGKRAHTFTLGSQRKTGVLCCAFSRKVMPGRQTVLLVFLDYRGPLPYRSILPADRPLPGMHGTFTIR